MAGVIKNLVNTIKYGRQIGSVHQDGAVLRKGNGLLGNEGVKTLLDKDGEVKKFIIKNRRNEDMFEVVHATPIKGDWRKEFNVEKFHYIKHSSAHQILKDSFIGKFFDGSEGGNRGWFLTNPDGFKSEVLFDKKMR